MKTLIRSLLLGSVAVLATGCLSMKKNDITDYQVLAPVPVGAVTAVPSNCGTNSPTTVVAFPPPPPPVSMPIHRDGSWSFGLNVPQINVVAAPGVVGYCPPTYYGGGYHYAGAGGAYGYAPAVVGGGAPVYGGPPQQTGFYSPTAMVGGRSY